MYNRFSNNPYIYISINGLYYFENSKTGKQEFQLFPFPIITISRFSVWRFSTHKNYSSANKPWNKRFPSRFNRPWQTLWVPGKTSRMKKNGFMYNQSYIAFVMAVINCLLYWNINSVVSNTRISTPILLRWSYLL